MSDVLSRDGKNVATLCSNGYANATLDYYNQNAVDFCESTVGVEFANMQDRFAQLLPKGSTILDLGCGSGRDSKYFLEQGFYVEATDGSKELCKRASAYAGIAVRCELFLELDEQEKYDGIWACSSILHLPLKDLEPMLCKMRDALKEHGVIYTSFKYGDFEGMRNGRYFTNLTEESFGKLLDKVAHLELKESWITGDVRPGRGDERWLNVILQKQ